MMLRQNFTMAKGDSRTLRIPLVDEDGDPYKAASGSTAKWWAAPSVSTASGSVPIKKSTSGGITLEETSTQTTIVVTIAPADTSGLAAGDYYHEAELTSGSNVYTVMNGTLRLLPALVV